MSCASLLALTIEHMVSNISSDTEDTCISQLKSLPYDLRELVVHTLTMSGNMTPQLLITLASNDLQHLDLSPITTVSSVYQKHPRTVWQDTICTILATCGPSLFHLNLSYHRFSIPTPDLLSHHILPSCSHLTHLIIHASSGITNVHVHEIMTCLMSLQVMIITGDRKLKWPEEEWGIMNHEQDMLPTSTSTSTTTITSRSSYPALQHIDLSGCASLLSQQSLLYTCDAWRDSMTYLDLSAVTMTTCHDTIAWLHMLETVVLKGNRLTTLPDSFSSLSHLTHLDLSGNLFSIFPSVITCLPITWLSLRANRMDALCSNVGDMMTLTHLDCSFNALRSLPESLLQLSALEMLDLDYNYISMPPNPIPMPSSHIRARGHHPHIPTHLVTSACYNNSELSEQEREEMEQQQAQQYEQHQPRGILKISYNA